MPDVFYRVLDKDKDDEDDDDDDDEKWFQINIKSM